MTAVGDSIEEQYARGIAAVSGKWKEIAAIPYLQSNSCTYGIAERLRELYKRCASLPGAVMLAIATRADCLSDDVIAVIREMSEHIPVLVELGLQTSNDRTAEIINRCHTAAEFAAGYTRLRAAGGDVAICVHIINGLPGESRADMLETARFTAALNPDMVKLHLLHVLRGTPLYDVRLRRLCTDGER